MRQLEIGKSNSPEYNKPWVNVMINQNRYTCKTNSINYWVYLFEVTIEISPSSSNCKKLDERFKIIQITVLARKDVFWVFHLNWKNN